MRSAQKSNRPRGRGNRKGNGGTNLNRVYESNGPDGKVRGTPQQIIDKYLTLARDAQTSSDRVNAENFLQHAEHYQRLLATAMGAQQERREQTNAQPDDDQQDRDDRNARSDEEDRQPQAQAAQAQPKPQESKDRADRGNGGQRPPRSTPAVSGMQTIDSGQDQGGPELIVTPEEFSGKPKRRNGESGAAADGDTTEPSAE